MGYCHLENLYRAQDVLLFRELWALEKADGTSSHIQLGKGGLTFFSGSASHVNFMKLFDRDAIEAGLKAFGVETVTVYGEAYGGKIQGMSESYGKELRFISFDIETDEVWLPVPQADAAVLQLGLEFVPYRKISADLAAIDAERDRPSEIAVRRGCGPDRKREGVVLRPLIEVRKNNGERVIAKHKHADQSERATPQHEISPEKLAVLANANAIADEWVVPVRLVHVLDKLQPDGKILTIRDTPLVINALVEDVLREAAGEIVDSKEARAAIGKRAAELFKQRLK